MVGVALATTLIAGNVMPTFTHAAANTSTQATQQAVSNTSLGKVKIDQASYFELKDVNMLTSSNGKIVSFKVTINNKSNKDIFLIDYWVNLKSQSGTKYTVNLIPDDQKVSRIAANNSQTLTYYANVSGNLNLKDLKVEFIKWDFNQPNNELSLGSINIPATYNASTPAGKKRNIEVNGTTIQTSIDRFTMGKTEKFHKPIITFKMQNVGTQSFVAPAYEFKLVTASGLTYPLSAKGLENLTLTPKLSADITLTGSIPIEVDTKGTKLLVTLPVTDAKISLPVSSYNMPSVDLQTGGAIGKEYSFSTPSGDYYATVNSVHRLPLEDTDLLAADITITNKSSETLSIPNFTGKFVLDQNVEVTGSIVRFDKVIGIQPKSSISLQLYARIPYTYDFSEVKTVLQEKQEDDKVVDLIEFTHNSDLSSIRTIALNQKYYLNVVGKRANIGVRKVQTFESATANIFSVEMTAENLEKRFSNIASLHAYFETDTGLLYPANVEVSENKVAPGGTALVNFWKQLPKSIDTSKLKLVVGEAIVGDDGKNTGNYVNPVAYVLLKEDNTVATDLKSLELYPYTISISNIRTQINYENWDVLVTFNYELNKNLLVESKSDDHKLVLEVSDTEGKIKFSEEFALSGDKALELGQNKGEFKKSNSDLISQIQTLKDYNLNVYHQFQSGQRKLIASKKIRWFTTTD